MEELADAAEAARSGRDSAAAASLAPAIKAAMKEARFDYHPDKQGPGDAVSLLSGRPASTIATTPTSKGLATR